MERAYIVDEDGGTRVMEPVLVKDEDKEIQTLIHKNFNLIPGDQIDPESPCRWMLIKREMPVPDPYSNVYRWSIDFFFVDQNATPTFVECKRYLDTRSRREVVGQMLEYAANGQHYWSGETIRRYAEVTAGERGTTIEDCIRTLQSDVASSTDDFFQEIDRRLKAGEIRLIFFLEQAPHELKRLVEFLNKQMNLSEVLLVEARLFRCAATKVVIPRLFGFSEQARAIRRATVVGGTRAPVATDWESFASNASAKGLNDASIAGCKLLYEACKDLSADIAWGRGTVTASFSPKWKSLGTTAAPFSIYSTGVLELHLGSLQSSERAAAFARRFAELLGKAIKLRPDHITAWYQCPLSDWLANIDKVIAALRIALDSQLDEELVEVTTSGP